MEHLLYLAIKQVEQYVVIADTNEQEFLTVCTKIASIPELVL